METKTDQPEYLSPGGFPTLPDHLVSLHISRRLSLHWMIACQSQHLVIWIRTPYVLNPLTSLLYAELRYFYPDIYKLNKPVTKEPHDYF